MEKLLNICQCCVNEIGDIYVHEIVFDRWVYLNKKHNYNFKCQKTLKDDIAISLMVSENEVDDEIVCQYGLKETIERMINTHYESLYNPF